MFTHVHESSWVYLQEEAPDCTGKSPSLCLCHCIADFTVWGVHQKKKYFDVNTGCGREVTQNPAWGWFDRQRCYIPYAGKQHRVRPLHCCSAGVIGTLVGFDLNVGGNNETVKFKGALTDLFISVALSFIHQFNTLCRCWFKHGSKPRRQFCRGAIYLHSFLCILISKH